MKLNSLKDKIKLRSQEIHADVTAIRRHLHQHPELSFQEKETSAYVWKMLDAMGISDKKQMANTGDHIMRATCGCPSIRAKSGQSGSVKGR